LPEDNPEEIDLSQPSSGAKSGSPSLFELLEAAEADGLAEHNHARKLERLLGDIFRQDEYSSHLRQIPYNQRERAARMMDNLLATLRVDEETAIRNRYHLGKPGRINSENATTFVGPIEEGSFEQKALKKLENLARSLIRPETSHWMLMFEGLEPPRVPADITPVIEKIKRLTPALIDHLKTHEEDIRRIHWRVFEHLIAEFFASWGFHDVRLVGRNARTSADIYAATVLKPLEVEHRYFIEVKRWKDKVGIDVINQVLGAFIGERDRYGWHAAMIVTVEGFTDFEKWNREELKMKGIELREKQDLLRWLRDYKQNENGLWLSKSSDKL
jgi:hypothetical protein